MSDQASSEKEIVHDDINVVINENESAADAKKYNINKSDDGSNAGSDEEPKENDKDSDNFGSNSDEEVEVKSASAQSDAVSESSEDRKKKAKELMDKLIERHRDEDGRDAYMSKFSSIWAHKKEDQCEHDATVRGDEIADKLFEFQQQNHQKKYPFERSQYHQCIPNPVQQNQFITLQLVNRQMRAFDPKQKEEERKDHCLQYKRYDLKAPEDSDEDGYGSYTDSSDEKVEETPLENKLYAPQTLVEDPDPVVGIKNVEYAVLELNDAEESITDLEIAIIGFWNLNSEGVFRCMQSFEVPNPMKREIQDVQGTNLHQVLYSGMDGQIFFFYDQKSGEDQGLKIGILDLHSDQMKKKKNSLSRKSTIVNMASVKMEEKSVAWNCERILPIDEGSIIDKFIRDYNDLDIGEQKQLPNPTFVTRNGKFMIAFSTYLIQEKTSSDIAYEKEEERKKSNLKTTDLECGSHKGSHKEDNAKGLGGDVEVNSYYPSLYFYNIETNVVEWEILGAEIFINFNNDGDVIYLTNEAWQTWEFSDHEERHEKHKSFVNFIRWGKRPTKDELSNKEYQAPKLQVKRSFKLIFGENKGLEITKKCKVVEAHMHNDDKRVTLVYRGICAFTFILGNSRALEKKATYEGSSAKTDWRAEISFKERGSKFDGTGTDVNQKSFKITGEVEATQSNNLTGFIVEDKIQKELDLCLEIDETTGEIKVSEKQYSQSREVYYEIKDGKLEYDEERPKKSTFSFEQVVIHDESSENNESDEEPDTEDNTTRWADKVLYLTDYNYSEHERILALPRDKQKAEYLSIKTKVHEDKTQSWFFRGTCYPQRGLFEGTWGKSKDENLGELMLLSTGSKDAKIEITYDEPDADGKRKVLENKASLDLRSMKFTSDKAEDIKMETIEHINNCQLAFLINSPDVQFVRNDKVVEDKKVQDAYIQAKLVSSPDDETNGNGDGYVSTEVQLYLVSEEKSKKKSLEPDHREKIKFLLNQSFLASQERSDQQLWSPMPILIIKDQIVGSVVYEEMGTDDMVLEFFTSAFKRVDDEDLEYPQQPLSQEWIIDYPLLIYKHFSPDNHQIVVINLAQNAPQKIINLGQWEFVNFVHHTQMVEKKLFGKDHEVNSNIMFLATYDGKTRLMSFKSDPWLNETEEADHDSVKSSIFLFNGEIGERKNLNKKMAMAFPALKAEQRKNRRRFDADKMQNVQLLTKEIASFVQFSLIIQFNDSIFSISLNNKIDWKQQCEPNSMVRRHLVRGYNDQVFFGETSGNAEKIWKLELHAGKIGEMTKKDIYQLAGSRIVAFETDPENIQDDSAGHVRQAFYIMDDNQKIYHFVDEDGLKFQVEHTIDFSIHNEFKEVQRLKDQNWAHVHISSRSLTFDAVTYSLQTDLSQPVSLPKQYFGQYKEDYIEDLGKCTDGHPLTCCVGRPDDPAYAYGNAGCDLCGEEIDCENPDPKGFRRCFDCRYDAHHKCIEEQDGNWEIQSQQIIPMSTGLIAVGQRKHQEFCFLVKPSPGSRKLDLCSFAQIPEISDLVFISNNHILIKFGKDTTRIVHFKANGTVVHQGESADLYNSYYETNIIGQSELINGKKYIASAWYYNNYIDIIEYNEVGIGKKLNSVYDIESTAREQLRIIYKWESIKQAIQEADADKSTAGKKPAAQETKEPKRDSEGSNDGSENEEQSENESVGEYEYVDDYKCFGSEDKSWADLKESAMKPDYQKEAWYLPLNDKEKKQIEILRAAQKKQGDEEYLDDQPVYNEQQLAWKELDCKKVKNLDEIKTKVIETFENFTLSGRNRPGERSTWISPEGEIVFFASTRKPKKQEETEENLDVDPNVGGDKKVVPKKDAGKDKKKEEKVIPYYIHEFKTNEDEYDSKFKFKIIVFDCDTEGEQNGINDKTSFKIVGKYLLLRHDKDQCIYVNELPFGPDKLLMAGKPADQLQKRRKLNLDSLMRNNDLSYVKMYDVPRSSHILIKQRLTGKTKMIYYDNLLQVSLRNMSVIYNLDHMHADEEIKFMYSMDQFIDPDHFVNTGFTQSASWDHEEENEDISARTQFILTNEHKNLCFLKEQTIGKGSTKQQISGFLYQTYTEIDIMQLQAINNALSRKSKIPDIDETTIVSTFDGHTIFSIYHEDVRVYEQIYNQLTEKEFEDEENIRGQQVEQSYLRRLMQILNTPSNSLLPKPVKKVEDPPTFRKLYDKLFGPADTSLADSRGFQSITKKSLHFNNARFRDILMDISRLSKENTLGNFVENLEDLSILFEQMSPSVASFFEDCFLETEFCANVHNADWKTGQDIYVWGQDSSIVTEKKANGFITGDNPGAGKGTGRQNRMIDLKMLRIDWIFRENRKGQKQGFGDLVGTFASAPNDSTFSTNLVITLVMNFWDEYYIAVVRYCLIPFLIYFCSTVYYFSINLIDVEFRAALQDPDSDLYHNYLSVEFFNRCITILGMIYFGFFELIQLKREGMGYFTSGIWNFFDVSSIVLNTILLVDLFGKQQIDIELTRVIAFFTIFILWWKLIYWFRLFESTSFYIKLIIETIKGIGYFTIIFIVILMAFSNAIFILNKNRTEPDETCDENANTGQCGNMLYDKTFANDAVSTVLNQYLLSLGEFSTDNFTDGNNSIILWILFAVATFLSQITILNMLIAIMGDTFDNVFENKAQAALKEKLTLLNDFVFVVGIENDEKVKKFIFAASPKNKGDDESANWDGKIGAIKKTIEAIGKDQKSTLVKKIALIQGRIDESTGKVSQLEEKVDGLQGLNQKQIELLLDIKRDIAGMKDKGGDDSTPSPAKVGKVSLFNKMVTGYKAGAQKEQPQVAGMSSLQSLFKSNLKNANTADKKE